MSDIMTINQYVMIGLFVFVVFVAVHQKPLEALVKPNNWDVNVVAFLLLITSMVLLWPMIVFLMVLSYFKGKS